MPRPARTTAALVGAVFLGAAGLLPTAAAAAAVPNVTVVPLRTGTCFDWPGWQNDLDRIDITAPVTITIDQAENGTVNGLVASSTDYSWPPFDANDTTGHWNFTALTFDLRSREYAKMLFFCIDGVMKVYNGLAPPSITINRDWHNGFLMETYAANSTTGNTVAGYEVEVYRHVDPATNKTLPGVFLGALNQTTWGFHTGEDDASFYEARLEGLPLDPNTLPRAGYQPTFSGFLRVDRI
ncbi:hypothetical protein SPI_03862 [Niveomyces insectorum RCEF 264]|uniref:Concanavalin A-like lectin/glucanase, subgroup n=1 Tax=Niveomyces insectorum RCEF 264 TaxID=1081102 RepID=A0A167WEX9_9HYPO|nr:hypothetical protein SPI_03862 [Niveomyces insectorum RCEF 264]